jgi:hypothetical protein
VESRLLGFPYFPYSVISMACFGMRVQRAELPENPVSQELVFGVEPARMSAPPQQSTGQ